MRFQYQYIYQSLVLLSLWVIQIYCSSLDQQYSQCLSSFYKNIFNQECLSCPIKCQGCIDQQCLTCSVGLKQNNQCLDVNQSCPSGQYFNKSTMVCNNCNVPFCLACSSINQCTQCQEGFKLKNGISCQQISDSSIGDKYIKNTCPSRQYEFQGDCLQQQICTSKSYSIQENFTMDVIQMIDYSEKSLLIGISNDLVILYNLQNMVYVNTIFSLPYQTSEYILYGALYKNTLNILTHKNIFTFDLDSQKLISKYRFTDQQVKSDLNNRQIFISQSNNVLTYLSLTDIQRNIKFIQFNINYIQSESFTLSAKTATKNLLPSDNVQAIYKYFYFQDIQIATILIQDYVYFVNIQKGSLVKQEYTVLQSDNKRDQIFSNQVKESDGSVAFYFMKGTNLINIVKIFYKISPVGDDSAALVFNLNDFPKPQYESLDYMKYEIFQFGNKFYHLAIVSSFIDLFNVGNIVQISFFEIEYFFQLEMEQYFKFQWLGPMYLVQGPTSAFIIDNTNQERNHFQMIISHQNKLRFFEFDSQNQQVIEFESKISFTVSDSDLIIKESISKNIALISKGTIIGRLDIPFNENNIQYKQTRQESMTSKQEIFFNNLKISKIVIASNLKTDKASKNSFIIYGYQSHLAFSVIQVRDKSNGESQVVGYKLYYYSNLSLFSIIATLSISIEEDSYFDDDNQVLYVISTLGVYSISYDSLNIINVFPFKQYMLKIGDYIFYKELIVETSQLNISRIKFYANGLPNYDSYQVYTQAYDINKPFKVLSGINKYSENTFFAQILPAVMYFEIVIELQPCYLLDYLPDEYIDAKFISSNEIILLSKEFMTFKFIKINLDTCIFFKELQESDKVLTDKESLCTLRAYSNFSYCLFIGFRNGDLSYSYVGLSIIDWREYPSQQTMIKHDVFEIDSVQGNYIYNPQLLQYINEGEIESEIIIVINRFYSISSQFSNFSIIAQLKISNISGEVISMKKAFQISSSVSIISPQNPKVLLQYTVLQNQYRLYQKNSMISYAAYLQFEVTNGEDDVQLWRDSFIFRDQNQAKILRKINELPTDQQIQIDQYIQIIDDLGLILVLKSNLLLLVCQDQLTPVYQIAITNQASLYARWSSKYQTLVIIDGSKIDFYIKQYQFDRASLSTSIPNNQQAKCLLLSYTPVLVCNQIGIYDFESKSWYLNSSINIYNALISEPFIAENEYFIALNDSSNIVLFNFLTKEYLQTKKMNFVNKDTAIIYLQEGIKNQIAIVDQNQECGIYSLPVLSKIFYESSATNGFLCLYHKQTGSLMIRNNENVRIYKLPFTSTNSVTKQATYEIKEGSSILMSQKYILQVYQTVFLDGAYTTQINYYNINTGITQNQIFVLYQYLEGNLQYWEEKDVVFNNKVLMQIGDLGYGWNQDLQIIDYSIRFNYLFSIKVENNQKYLRQIDISEVFPSNQKTAQFLNYLRTQNYNFYQNNYAADSIYNDLYDNSQSQDSEYVIYLDLQTYHVRQLSLVTLQSQLYLDLRSIDKFAFEQDMNYKTSHQIYKLTSQSSNKLTYLVLSLKCQLFILSKQQLVEIINLFEISNSCQYTVIDDGIWILKSDKKSFLNIYIQEDGKVGKKILATNLQNHIEEFFIDQKGNWVFIKYQNPDNLEIYSTILRISSNQILDQRETSILTSLITKAEFIYLKYQTLIFIGQRDSSVHLYNLQISQDKILLEEEFSGTLNCDSIRQFSYLVQEGQDTQKVDIYFTCKTRISVISGQYNTQSGTISQPLRLQAYVPIHSRSYEHSIKILKNKYVAVLSGQQITIYSMSLQYLGRIEERTFQDLKDIVLAPDNLTFFVTDTNDVHIYRISLLNSSKKLILQQTYEYVSPQIYSAKYLYQNQAYIIALGIDINGFFQINYLPSIYESTSLSCFTQINNYITSEQQIQQYLYILQQRASESEQTLIQLNIVSTNSQNNIQLPIKEDSQVENDKVPYLKQRIAIDLDLNTYQVSLTQYSQFSTTKMNLLKTVKISNGSILINNDITFDNMNFVIFKDLTIIFQTQQQIKFLNVESVKFDNCKIKINQYGKENHVFFSFESVTQSQLTSIKLDQKTLAKSSLFSFLSCNETQIKSFEVTGLKFSSLIPLIQFNKQTNKVIISDIFINQSSLQSFLLFSNCKTIALSNINVEKLSYFVSESVRLLQDVSIKDESDSSSLPFIVASYIYDSFTIDGIKINNQSYFHQLISYQNWVYDYELIGSKQQKIKRQSIQSKINIQNIQISSSIFYKNLLDIEENTIDLNSIILNQNKECSLFFKNATKYLNIQNFKASHNEIITNQQIISIQSSLVLIKSLLVESSNLNKKLDTTELGTYQGFIELKQSDFLVDDLQGKSNILSSFFLLANGDFPYTYDVAVFGGNKVRTIGNSLIFNTNGGGGIQVVQLSSLNLSYTKILHNEGSKKGGGVSAYNIKQISFDNVEIAENIALLYGGGVYLEDSDLSLINSNIHKNSAKVGGGVKYNNTSIYPTFLTKGLEQIQDNQADIFGDNYGSVPTKIGFIESSLEDNNLVNNYIEAVSSANQQYTTFKFQLYGEDGNLVYLPNKSDLTGQLKIDLINYYEFLLKTDSNYMTIQQQSVTSSYNFVGSHSKDNHLLFQKYIINTGYKQLKQGHLDIENSYSISIESVAEFQTPQSSSKGINQQKLTKNFKLQFRQCEQGEIVRQVVDDFYECWKCADNTFSLVDPYSNSLQNTCQNCVKNALSCDGSKITPLEGYWVEQNTTNVMYCINSPTSCTQQEGSKMGCAEGFYGPLCESCDYNNYLWQNKTYAKKGKYNCTICSDKISQNYQIALSIIFGIAFLIYLFYQISSTFNGKILKLKIQYLKWSEIILVSNSINENEKSSFAIKILIAYFQIISIVFLFQIQVPSGFKAIQFFGNSIETTLYSLDCFFVSLGLQKDTRMVYLRLIWTLLQPIFYIIILICIFILFPLISRTKQKNRWKNLLISGLLQIFFMVYPSIIQQSIGSFSCKLINNTNYVLNDLQFTCYDKQYYIVNFCISLPLIIITLAIPYLIMRKLNQCKDRLTSDPNIFLQYGYFFSEYKSAYCYWEIIKIYQKIFIFIIISIFNQSTLISSIMVSIIIIFYLKFQIRIQPFTNTIFNKLEYTSQISAIVTILSLAMNVISTNDIISTLSIAAAILYNVYFGLKFLFCFSSFIIYKPQLKFILNILIKLQKMFPQIFQKIQDKNVNIIRLTKNWKILKVHLFSKKLEKINTYNINSRKSVILKSKQPTQQSNQNLFTNRRLISQNQDNNLDYHKNQDKFNINEFISPSFVFTPSLIVSPGRFLKILSQNQLIKNESQTLSEEKSRKSKTDSIQINSESQSIQSQQIDIELAGIQTNQEI